MTRITGGGGVGPGGGRGPLAHPRRVLVAGRRAFSSPGGVGVAGRAAGAAVHCRSRGRRFNKGFPPKKRVSLCGGLIYGKSQFQFRDRLFGKTWGNPHDAAACMLNAGCVLPFFCVWPLFLCSPSISSSSSEGAAEAVARTREKSTKIPALTFRPMVPPPLLDRMAAGRGGSPPLLYPFSLKALCGGWLPGQRQRMDPESKKKGGK